MFGFAEIAGGAPSSVAGMTQHLMNMTMSQDMALAAQYYQRGMVVDPLADLAKQVADKEISFSEALDAAMSDYIRKGGDVDQLEAAEERLTKRLSAMALRIGEGLGDAPVAVLRPDISPLVCAGLGIDPDEILTTDQINALLAGRRADGEPIEKKKYAVERELPADSRTGVRKWSTPIGSYDFCATPDKSVSVAWAFSGPAEQAQIYNAHIEAFREALAYIADEVGQAVVGKGSNREFEPGSVGWIEFTHHTTRRVQIVTPSQSGGRAEVVDAGLPGDMNLHTHGLIPNAVFCESGRVGSLDTMAVRGFLFEAGSYYQARLGTKLRQAGFAVELDPHTGAARMPLVPDHVRSLFSKRTNQGEQLARKAVLDEGKDWDSLSHEEQTTRTKEWTQRWESKQKNDDGTRKKDDIADLPDWQRQAKDARWEVPRSFQFIGPQLPELTDEQRHRKAYEIGLPWLADKLEHRSVVPHWDLRLAALRGLVETGCEGLPDIKEITTLMRREGVTQYGEQTGIVWGQESDKRYTSVTTALHERDEEEFVRLARGASRDKSGSIPTGLLKKAIEESGLDFTDAHGKRQRQVIELMGNAGRLGVAVGTAGAGKTAMLTPIVAALKEMGRDVHGASLAWRQTDDLVSAGIDKRNLKAFSVMIDAIENGSLKLTENSVVAVDELGLLGTRQGLQLLRAREKHGFTVIALGDDKQCSSIQAGAIIDLARRALGPEQVPEILTTKRQQTERERTIVGLLREGRAAEALDMKRADGTAELAYGGREGVIRRVAGLWAERVQATGAAPTISAPTNSDAHQIGEQVRQERRKMGQIGQDIHLQKATDGDRDYTLRLAAGDRVRLFRSTRADMGEGVRKDGRKYRVERSIGRNGSVVEVVTANTLGVTLKAADGRTGTVKWSDMPSKGGRTMLAYGYATTIHTSQGSTAEEHIFALPSGSASVTGAAGYTASTRHTKVAYLVSSEVAERIAVKESRPINDAHDITLDDKWSNVAKNFVNQRKTDSALDMLQKVGQVNRGAVKAFHYALRPEDPRNPNGPSHVGDLVHRLKLDRLMERVSQTIERVRQIYTPDNGLSR